MPVERERRTCYTLLSMSWIRASSVTLMLVGSLAGGATYEGAFVSVRGSGGLRRCRSGTCITNDAWGGFSGSEMAVAARRLGPTLVAVVIAVIAPNVALLLRRLLGLTLAVCAPTREHMLLTLLHTTVAAEGTAQGQEAALQHTDNLASL